MMTSARAIHAPLAAQDLLYRRGVAGDSFDAIGIAIFALLIANAFARCIASALRELIALKTPLIG